MENINFIDFIKSLVLGIYTAINESQVDQETKILELKSDLFLDDEAFAIKYNLKEQIIEENGKLKDEQIAELIKEKIEKSKEILETYFKNGYVKTIIDKCKMNAKFIYTIQTSTDSNSQQKSLAQKKSTYKNLPIEKVDLTKKIINLSNIPNLKSENILIHTIQPNKNNELSNITQNITSSIEIDFRTVIIN